MDLLVRQAVRDWSSGLRLACPLGMPGLTVRYLRTSEAKTRGHLHKRALQEDSVSGRGQKTRREEVQEEESRARLTITVKIKLLFLPEIRLARPMQLEDGARLRQISSRKNTSATVSKCVLFTAWHWLAV